MNAKFVNDYRNQGLVPLKLLKNLFCHAFDKIKELMPKHLFTKVEPQLA
jgi:hypothetical protein